jgi:hypothetical protein
VRQIITSDDRANDVRAAIHEIEPGKSQAFDSGSRSHLLYVINGAGGEFSFKGAQHAAGKGTGLYLEPGDKAVVTAGASPLTVLHLHVPKHAGKPTNTAPAQIGPRSRRSSSTTARSRGCRRDPTVRSQKTSGRWMPPEDPC